MYQTLMQINFLKSALNMCITKNKVIVGQGKEKFLHIKPSKIPCLM